MNKTIFSVFTFFFTLYMASVSLAQKLLKSQSQSVLLPSNIKIDGNALEWNNNFQCFNKNVMLYSTIANDNDHIYLVIKAVDPVIIKKVLAGGVQFTVCKSGERSEMNPFVINFPSTSFNHQLVIYQDINIFKASKRKDSLIINLNKTLLKSNKLIRLQGAVTGADSISVYNNIGVKEAIHFDPGLNLICEILIPLKLIGIQSLKSPIAYNVMLKGSSGIKPIKVGNKVTITDVPMGMSDDATFQIMNSPTDFWGVCLLAEK